MLSARLPPLIAHVVYRLDFGGLENGLVNLINRMPPERYRHAIICLTGFSEFARRIERVDVSILALHKRPGKDPASYMRLMCALLRLRPAIVHTRNIGTLDVQIPAALCGVRGRVHGEHGWDVRDLHGQNPRYRSLRRFCRRFVHRYIAMSRHLASWLEHDIQIAPERIRQIYNGVDTRRFCPAAPQDRPPWPSGFASANSIVVGSVGRLEQVKNPLALVRAFRKLVDAVPSGRERLRLVLVGGGPLHSEIQHACRSLGIESITWLPGARDDIPAVLRHLDMFVLPSLNEGISNTILEAMACAVPVVAARVGGNPELVAENETGFLYALADEDELCDYMRRYVEDAALRNRHGQRARALVEDRHTLDGMVRGYLDVYDGVLKVAR